MTIDTLIEYLNTYGYLIIAIALFFGIVGIPAPEESLLFLIGILIVQHDLTFVASVCSAFLGTIIGMLTAYACGTYLGVPFVQKFGKYIGLTEVRWHKIQNRYMVNAKTTLTLGYFLPGLRQVSPYFAGISKVKLRIFMIYSAIGAAIWIVLFIGLGYIVGSYFTINPKYIPYLSLLFFLLFILWTAIQLLVKKRKKGAHV